MKKNFFFFPQGGHRLSAAQPSPPRGHTVSLTGAPRNGIQAADPTPRSDGHGSLLSIPAPGVTGAVPAPWAGEGELSLALWPRA